MPYAGLSDAEELLEWLREEVPRSGSHPDDAAGAEAEWRALREEAERLWAVSADRGLQLRPGFRGKLKSPPKWVLRKLMRWYVEPVAYDQRSFNAAVLRLVDDLQERVSALEAREVAERGEADQSAAT